MLTLSMALLLQVQLFHLHGVLLRPWLIAVSGDEVKVGMASLP